MAGFLLPPLGMKPAPVIIPAGQRATHEHRILVCVDRSTFGDVCVRYAISLARALGSELTLVHVMEPHRVHVPHTDALDWEIARQEAGTYLERMEAEAVRTLGRPVDVRLEQGHPPERIVELAREIHADLTVLGGHGEGGVTPWNLGSTAHQVIAVSRGSVFIAQTSGAAEVEPPRRILVPLDGSRRTESVLPTAARIARAYGAELMLAHVVHDMRPTLILRATEDLELARELAAHLEISAKAYLEGLRVALVREGTPVQTLVVRHANERHSILHTSKHEHADLIVVAAHGTACDPERTFGSVTEYLLAHSHAPLLVLQDLPEAELHTYDLVEKAAPALRASFPAGCA
jgi:nucleotide-binding universal stress UspA family protein